MLCPRSKTYIFFHPANRGPSPPLVLVKKIIHGPTWDVGVTAAQRLKGLSSFSERVFFNLQSLTKNKHNIKKHTLFFTPGYMF